MLSYYERILNVHCREMSMIYKIHDCGIVKVVLFTSYMKLKIYFSEFLTTLLPDSFTKCKNFFQLYFFVSLEMRENCERL